MFEGKGLKCPAGFVQAKWHLNKSHDDAFEFDDDVTIKNFCSYLDKQKIRFIKTTKTNSVLIQLIKDN